jgi:hypothetical protein
MSYSINTIEENDSIIMIIQDGFTSIPLNPENRDYQEVLDAIIEQGAECFEGDIPQELLDAAEAKRLSNV